MDQREIAVLELFSPWSAYAWKLQIKWSLDEADQMGMASANHRVLYQDVFESRLASKVQQNPLPGMISAP
jgi:hypothetical protein